MDGGERTVEQWLEGGRTRKLRVTVVGAGNLGHVLCGILGARDDVCVSLLSSKAASIQSCVSEGILVRPNPKRVAAGGEAAAPRAGARAGAGAGEVVGRVYRCSSDPRDVIPDADVIMITVPSHLRPGLLRDIAPHVAAGEGRAGRPVYIGALPALGAFDWMASAALPREDRRFANVVVWGLKDVPFMCTRTVPGVEVCNLGPKRAVYLGLAAGCDDSDGSHARVLSAVLTRTLGIPVVRLPHFLAITLTPGNPIMHPAIMFGMFGPHSQWDGHPLRAPPPFYETVPELSAFYLQRLDDEVQDIKRVLERAGGVDLEAVWPLRLNLKQVYGADIADHRTLMLALRTNKSYATIRTPLKAVPVPTSAAESSSGAGGAAVAAASPAGGAGAGSAVGYVPDPGHRFFEEDVPYGLVILRGLAGICGVATPFMDEVLRWAQDVMGRCYLAADGSLTGPDVPRSAAPLNYGLTSVYGCVHGAARGRAKL